MIFENIKNKLELNQFEIVSMDQNRPWDGFFVISEEQAQKFANNYFEGLDVSSLKISDKLSPKILVVSPGKRLSWQYHHRRAEIWRVFSGQVGVKRSINDEEGAIDILNVGDTITLKQGERRRWMGLFIYSVIAEIWQYTDVNNASAEYGIVRVQDDFRR